MRLHRPVLAGLVLGTAVLPVTAANAATGVTAAGSAVSTATLATFSVGALADLVEAQSVSIGSLAATAQTVTNAAPSVTFVPITLNGVKTGAVTVTAANSPQTVGAVNTNDLGVLSATSPGATLMADDSSSALETSLGSLSVLGLPVTLDGGLDVGSATSATQSQAGKALSISNVELPNLADLLAALGLDLTKLPADTLNGLIEDLNVALDGAQQTAMDNANTAIGLAQQAVDDADGDVADATTALSAAAATLTSELSSANYPIGTSPMTAEEWAALDATVQATILALNVGDTGLADAITAYDAAVAALALAEDAIAPLTEALANAIAALGGIVDGILQGLPLLEVGAAEISTKALVGSAKTANVTGTISGVKVLGTDILETVTGDSELDVAGLVGDVADDVNAALGTVSAALSDVLSSVTGATGLVVPAPEIALMEKTTATGTDGAFGTADATVTALSVSLGSVTVPAIYALDDAAALPGLGAITGGFQTAPLSMKVGSLVESARFRPGAAAPNAPTPGNTGSLPSTGGPEGLAIVAVIGTALAVGIRRMRTQQ
ncbi:MAG TPA: hypothetical protein VNQ77_18385 [Frankiaceae bacterium]|nr:hypothetical protein [Frankiaceae bacterium]